MKRSPGQMKPRERITGFENISDELKKEKLSFFFLKRSRTVD